MHKIINKCNKVKVCQHLKITVCLIRGLNLNNLYMYLKYRNWTNSFIKCTLNTKEFIKVHRTASLKSSYSILHCKYVDGKKKTY